MGILLSTGLFDKYGRRAMMLPSCVLSSICMYMVGLAFQLGVSEHQKLALFGIFGYLLFFGFGLCPGPWIINSEIYPLHVRGLGNAAATTTNWVANYVVSASFLTLVRVLGRPGVFISFGCIGLMGARWIYVELPETANKTLEEIQLLFEQPEDCDVVVNGTHNLSSSAASQQHQEQKMRGRRLKKDESHEDGTENPLMGSEECDSEAL
jgi:MFS family permease